MNVLVINCGSSSIKHGMYGMPSGKLAGKGIVDRIVQKPSRFKNERGDRKETREVEIEDHRQGVHLILDSVLDENGGLATGESKAKILVIPTNEEPAIAANTCQLLTRRSAVTAPGPSR